MPQHTSEERRKSRERRRKISGGSPKSVSRLQGLFGKTDPTTDKVVSIGDIFKAAKGTRTGQPVDTVPFKSPRPFRHFEPLERELQPISISPTPAGRSTRPVATAPVNPFRAALQRRRPTRASTQALGGQLF